MKKLRRQLGWVKLPSIIERVFNLWFYWEREFKPTGDSGRQSFWETEVR